MRRREFITLIAGAVIEGRPITARAQLAGGAVAAWPLSEVRSAMRAMPLIGLLSPQIPTSSIVNGLREGLQELGYSEGKNLRIEYRFTKGNFDQLAEFARELVALKVDLIVALVTQASVEAKKATATIPIVMVGVADPIGAGLIASFDHPGGNVTGTSSVATDIVSKQLGILKTAVPDTVRIAALWNPANLVFQAQQRQETEAAAQKLGVNLQLIEARALNEFEAAFATVEGTRSLFIMADPLFGLHARSLADLSLKYHLVTISGDRTFPDAGGLMAYGPSYFDLYKRAAFYTDRILKGARPADLPVEQPTKFQFIVNLRTAKSLGIDLPSSIVALADEVIE